MTADPRRVKELFGAALELPDAPARRAYLDRECGGEAELRRRLDVLLRAHDDPASVLDRPLAAVAPADCDATGVESPSQAPTGAAPPGPEAVGMLLAGKYRLLELIGEGGMGAVWMAKQAEPVQRLVAVKLIKPGLSSRPVLARFEAERQALALMDHPNIARIFDGGLTRDGRPFFVMELVTGVPVTRYCDEHRLAPRQRLELFIPVCQAIQHAHQKGIIHRDVKPSNVLVALYDDKPVVKVIDFGVAKATGPHLSAETLHTSFGAVVGTVEYMSPEQAGFNQLDVDTRSDIYSLGVLLYELLTGGPPFGRQELEKAGMLEGLRLIREQEPPKPSTRLNTSKGLPALAVKRGTEPKRLTALVTGEVDWIVMKALEKDRNSRYESASALAADVRRYLNDEPVQACPPSAWYRLRKFVRRNRGPVLAAGVVFLALLCGVIGTTLGLAQSRQAEQEAREAQARVERERDAAVEAGKETFDALIDLTDISSQYLLIDKRVYGPKDREFLERMAARYERLATRLSDAAEAQAMRARSLSQVGQAHVQLGDFDRGVDAWRRAIGLYRSQPPERPADTDEARSEFRTRARQCRAVALAAEKLRRWPEAVEFASLQIEFARAALAPEERPDLDLLNLLLTGNWSLTISLTAAGRIDEALAPWEEMVRLVAWADQGVNEGACEHLGRVATKLIAAGKTADPALTLAPALAERRALLSADPTAAEPRRELRQAYRVMGLFHEKLRKFPDALDAYDKAIALGAAPPAEADPRVKNERALVFGALIGRAVCLDALGRDADAQAAWEAMCQFTETKAAEWLAIRALHLAGKGQPERAVRMAEETLLQPGAGQQYNGACVYSVASADPGLSPDRKEKFALRAVALLEEARAAGLFHPNLAAHAKTDADLNPVRERDDFKKLMARLEAGKGKDKK